MMRAKKHGSAVFEGVGAEGFEPPAISLKGSCSTD